MKICMETVSSLDKVFPQSGPTIKENSGSMLRNERFHFQVSVQLQEGLFGYRGCRFCAESDIGSHLEISVVELLPADFANVCGHDDYVLGGDATLYPELLRPIEEAHIVLLPFRWLTFWITVNGGGDIAPGIHDIKCTIYGADGVAAAHTEYRLEVIDGSLPETDLLLTSWIHCDCICERHGVSPFGAAFYKIFGKYLENYTEHGYNTLYTPLFTPPLDTDYGTERQTIQLVDVFRTENGWRFGFSRLKRFMDFAKKHGVKYFEFSHLFSQGGAEYAPKIVARENGGEVKLFGWKTRSDDGDYLEFLSCFLKELHQFLITNRFTGRCFCHISDEPKIEHIERYAKLQGIVRKYFPDVPVIDALSDPDFASEKLVDYPVAGSHRADEFAEKGIPHWVYYCCGQYDRYLSNRFFCMPSQRARVIGFQMYMSGALGFLHWGYNFYRSGGSEYPIDPFRITDAGGCFPSGDAFIVYPKKDGVLNSLRNEVMGDAFQDYRALLLLEKFIGKSGAKNLLKREVCGYTEYPRSAEWHRNKRFEINEKIKFFIKTVQKQNRQA